ncbi:DNA topoisomerase IB [Dongia deserti]|uniref:DNA topoisomerase IB n=1 Tax=Dongia deserti TaxID=2268030 RepID=UPI000E65B5C7|nr:DNA topoisomerase IB [Dongia deserti]
MRSVNEALRPTEPSPIAGDAERAGLEYVNDDDPGIRRQKRGKGFVYLDSNGKPVRDPYTRARIRSLAIPPAWTDVWICASENGHLQATGRDAKGRKQYRYHVDFIAIRDSAKYERLVDFAKSLPALRAEVARRMALPGLPSEKVLATIVHLLDVTLIRIGNDSYARENNSYGVTTLRDSHVRINGSELRFHFKGKSGKAWRLTMRDRRIAKIIRSCQELPGQHLFQYLDEKGDVLRVTSTDVNDHLRRLSGGEVTAKDFRTWAGTVLAANLLHETGGPASATAAKRQVRAALQEVAARLGNTVAICRKCYVHPSVLEAYTTGELRLRRIAAKDHALPPEEAATLRFLQRRLKS